MIQFIHSETLSSVPPDPFPSVLIQKRLKKEKRNKRRLQEALEEEVKLRDQAEHTLLHTANAHTGTPTENFLCFRCFIGVMLAGIALVFVSRVTESVQQTLGC